MLAGLLTMRAGEVPSPHVTLHQQAPPVGVWGEGITLPNANIRWAPLCHGDVLTAVRTPILSPSP